MLVKRILFALNGSLVLIFLLYFITVPFRKSNVSHQNGTFKNLISVETSQTRTESLISTDQIENNCSSNFIAFIVPYRNRTEQLPQFLQAIHNHQNNNVNNVSN